MSTPDSSPYDAMIAAWQNVVESMEGVFESMRLVATEFNEWWDSLPTEARGAIMAFRDADEQECEKLQTVTSVPCRCRQCGWRGRVGDCEPDVDGDGSLGCPACLSVLSVRVPGTLWHRGLRWLAHWLSDLAWPCDGGGGGNG